MAMGFISRFLTPAKPPACRVAFEAVVAQARDPVFFTTGQVPDTIEGRFELLLLHLFIVLHGVRNEPGAEDFAQALFDTAFQHLDWNLREIGVGDMTVGKKIKRMAEIFYGRITQYRTALAAGEAPLAEMIGSTLYPATARPDAGILHLLAAYTAASVTDIATGAPAVITGGQVVFPVLRA